MKIGRYEVDICEGCMKLQGEMCHTPGCALIRATTEEIKEILDRIQIRFEIKCPADDTKIWYEKDPVMTYEEESA